MEHTTKKASWVSVVVSMGVLTLVSWLALQPLSRAGFFPMHDDTQVARVVVMSRAITQGQFPVRLVSDLGYGYGYPIYNFYGPLPYYVGALFTHLGFSALESTKIMFAIGILLLGWSTFALVASFWGPLAGMTAGVLTQFAPYHAVQIYVRGAVGEFWASAFIPFVLLGFLLSGSVKTRRIGVRVGGVGLAFVILSHTVTGFATVVGCIIFILGFAVYALMKREQRMRDVIGTYITTLLVGLGLTAFFWFPAVAEMQFTSVAGQIGATANYKDHFVCLAQFWNSPWGYGGSIPGCIDGVSFKLGKVHLAFGLLGFIFLYISKRSVRTSLYWVGVLLIISGGMFATSISAPFWRVVPQLAYIQYPWRFITIIELGLAVLAGGLVLQKSRYVSGFVAICIVTLTLWNTVYLFAPQYSYPRDDADFETPSDLRFRASKVSDEYLPSELIRPTQIANVVFDTIESTGSAVVTKIRDDTTSAEYHVISESSVDIRVNKAFFPGWKYWVNDEEVIPRIKHGLPELTLPAGKTVIVMRFVDTPVRTTGNIVTLVFILGLVLYYGKSKKTIT